MKNGNAPSWKTAVVAGSMALASQTSLAADTPSDKVNDVLMNVANATSIVSGENSDLTTKLGVGALVLAALGGGSVGLRRMKAANRRKAIRQEIQEFLKRFRQKLGHVPESFLEHHFEKTLDTVRRLESCTDEQIDDILKGGRAQVVYGRDTEALNDKAVKTITDKFDIAKNEVTARMGSAKMERDKFLAMQNNLKQQGYKFADIALPPLDVFADHDETLSAISTFLRTIEQKKLDLGKISSDYNSLQGIEIQVQKELETKKADLKRINPNYLEICAGTQNLSRWKELEKEVALFLRGFQMAYGEKDIDVLNMLSEQRYDLIDDIRSTSRLLQQDINWYKDIPISINKRDASVKDLQRQKMAQLSGKARSHFASQIVALNQVLALLRQMHASRASIPQIAAQLEDFDRGCEFIVRSNTTDIESIPSVSREESSEEGTRVDFQATVPWDDEAGTGFQPTEPMSL